MNESDIGAESDESKVELLNLLRDLSDHGFDFTEEDLPFLQEMDGEELRAYFVVGLEAAGVQNPFDYLEANNIIEQFRDLTTEELAARNSPTLSGDEYFADELDALDSQAGNT